MQHKYVDTTMEIPAGSTIQVAMKRKERVLVLFERDHHNCIDAIKKKAMRKENEKTDQGQLQLIGPMALMLPTPDTLTKKPHVQEG